MFVDMDGTANLYHYYGGEEMDVNPNTGCETTYPLSTNINTTNTMTYALSSFYQGSQLMMGGPLDDDEDEVKRPMNSFLLWAKIMRKKYASENPNMHNAEISKLLGKIWNSMTSKDKRPFVEQAEKLRVLHMRTYPNYRYAPKRRKERRSHRMISPEVAAALHSTLFDVNNIISEQLSQNQIHGQDLKSYGYLRKVCEKNKNKPTKEQPSNRLQQQTIQQQPQQHPTFSSSSFNSNMNMSSCSPASSESSYGTTVPENGMEHIPDSTTSNCSSRKELIDAAKSETMTLHYYPITQTSQSCDSRSSVINSGSNFNFPFYEENNNIHNHHKNDQGTADKSDDSTDDDEKSPCALVTTKRLASVNKRQGISVSAMQKSIIDTDKDNSIEEELPDYLKVLINTPLHQNQGNEDSDPMSFWSDIGDIISAGSL